MNNAKDQVKVSTVVWYQDQELMGIKTFKMNQAY